MTLPRLARTVVLLALFVTVMRRISAFPSGSPTAQLARLQHHQYPQQPTSPPNASSLPSPSSSSSSSQFPARANEPPSSSSASSSSSLSSSGRPDLVHADRSVKKAEAEAHSQAPLSTKTTIRGSALRHNSKLRRRKKGRGGDARRGSGRKCRRRSSRRGSVRNGRRLRRKCRSRKRNRDRKKRKGKKRRRRKKKKKRNKINKNEKNRNKTNRKRKGKARQGGSHGNRSAPPQSEDEEEVMMVVVSTQLRTGAIDGPTTPSSSHLARQSYDGATSPIRIKDSPRGNSSDGLSSVIPGDTEGGMDRVHSEAGRVSGQDKNSSTPVLFAKINFLNASRITHSGEESHAKSKARSAFQLKLKKRFFSRKPLSSVRQPSARHSSSTQIGKRQPKGAGRGERSASRRFTSRLEMPADPSLGLPSHAASSSGSALLPEQTGDTGLWVSPSSHRSVHRQKRELGARGDTRSSGIGGKRSRRASTRSAGSGQFMSSSMQNFVRMMYQTMASVSGR